MRGTVFGCAHKNTRLWEHFGWNYYRRAWVLLIVSYCKDLGLGSRRSIWIHHHARWSWRKPKVAGTWNAYEIRAAIWPTVIRLRDCPILRSISLGISLKKTSPALSLFPDFGKGVDCCFSFKKTGNKDWTSFWVIKEPDDRTASWNLN